MPIVFVHGVAQRNQKQFGAGVEVFLREYVAPCLNAASPDSVVVESAYWGRLGAAYAWKGASVPAPFARQMGAGEAELAIAASIADVPSLVKQGDDEADAVANELMSAQPRTTVVDPLAILTPAVAEKIIKRDKALGNGLGADMAAASQGVIPGRVQDTINEALERFEGSPGALMSRVLRLVRGPVNATVTRFLGDIFVYLNGRTKGRSVESDLRNKGVDEDPGAIPQAVLDVLLRAGNAAPGEPLVVLSHSMGGQIMYDIVTYFLPKLKARDPGKWGNLTITFWAAAACQVGLFEEMKLFKASSADYSAAKGNKVPGPSKELVGYWWSIWDPNDFLSYKTADIFERVDDYKFDGGVSVLAAHGAYLVRPSFYRKMAELVDRNRTQ